MSDLNYIIEILLKARDEASPKIDALKAKIDELKATNDASDAEKDLSKALDKSTDSKRRNREETERGGKAERDAHDARIRASEELRAAQARYNRQEDATRRSTTNRAASEEKLAQREKELTEAREAHTAALEAENKVLGRSGKAHDDASDSVDRSTRAKKTHADNQRRAIQAHEDEAKSVETLEEAYARLGKKEKELQGERGRFKSDDQLKQRRQDLQSLGDEYARIGRAMRKEDLDNAKAREALDKAEKARAEAEQLRTLAPGSRQPLANETAEKAVAAKRAERERQAARETELNISKMSSLWDDFLAKKNSGSLTEEQTRRDAKDMASGWNEISREVRKAGGDAEQYGIKADRAAKIAKNAKVESTGGFANIIGRKDVGAGLEYIDAKFDNVGVRVSGVASTIRGFFDLLKIGFSQQIVTGLVSLAGGLISVASAAVQAGAALAGAFVSGLGQAIPMIAVVIASVERFKQILSAVSVAGQAEQQRFFDPTEKQVTQLQNTSQLISAQQQLSNSYVQVFEAQQRVRDSQIALTEARYTAMRQITELANAEKNARLQAEGASLSLTAARRELQVATERGNVAGIKQAELGVREAELTKKTSEYAIPKAEREARLAKERGVSGAPSVISATEGAEGAKVALLQAAQAGEAAKRQMQITELQQQARSSKETTYESQLKFLEKSMSPTELGLTNALIGIEKELKSPDSPLKKITDYFVEPFTNAVERIRSLLKNTSFLEPIDELAKAMGAGLGRLEKATYGPGGTNFFETMAVDASKNIPIVVEAIEHLMHLFEDIAKAADPAFKKMSEDWDRFWGKLDSKYSTPKGLSGLEEFFNKSVRYAEQFARLGLALGGLFKAIGHDAAPQGLATVTSFTGAIESATNWVKTHGPEVTKFFGEAREGLSLIGQMLFGIGISMVKVFSLTSLTAFNGVLQEVILPGLRNMVTILGFVVTKVLQIIGIFGKFGLDVVETIATIGFIVVAVSKVVAIVKDVIKAWAEVKLAIEAASAPEILLSPWIALGAIITGVVALLGGFSEKQHKNKISTDEVNEALERQEEALRTIKNLNDEYKGSKLGVEEARTQLTSSEQSLSRTRKEGPAHGESDAEYAVKVKSEEEQVQRSRLGYEERQKEFFGLPERQKETVNRELRENKKNYHTVNYQYAGEKEELAELQSGRKAKEELYNKFKNPQNSMEAEFKQSLYQEVSVYNRKIIEKEKEVQLARENVAIAAKKSNELIHASNESVAQAAPRLSAAYEEAYSKFEQAVKKGEVAAGTGMTKIKHLVDESLKKYGVTPAEIASSGTNTGEVNTEAGHRVASEKEARHASGAWIEPQAGGHRARLGEAGHSEVVLSTDPAHASRSRSLLGRYLQNAPHMAQGGPVGYESPFHGNVQWGRSDQGTDVDLTPGSPITAIGEAQVKGIIPNWYAGQPYIWYELLSGIDKGKFIYIAEQINRLAKVGQILKEGAPVAYYAPSGTGIETGWSTSSGNTLAMSTSGYTEGQATPAGKAFTSFLKALAQGKTIAGETAGGVSKIIAPHIKGGGAIGGVAQGALDIAAKAANIYVAKAARASGGSGGLGGGGAGKLGPANKAEFARYLASYTGLPVKFLGAWINREQGATTVEGGNNWLNIETGGPGGGSGPYSPTAKWVERHTPQQAAKIESEWLRANLPQLLRAKNASEAVTILENSGYATSHYGHEAPSSFLSAYAAGGLVGDHVRRIALRHIRRKVLKFAEGGRAPWGGRPVPIIAHEGERIMNPAQFGETARLAGTTPSGLDHHLGYDTGGKPRQSFAAGGKPAPYNFTAPSFPELELFTSGFGTMDAVIKVMKNLSKAFKDLSKLKGEPEKYSTELVTFIEKLTESGGVFERLTKGREVLKTTLTRKAFSKEYKGAGNEVALGAGGQPAIDVANTEILAKETEYLNNEAKVVRESKSKILAQIKALSKHKKPSAKTTAALTLLRGAYNSIVTKQNELAESMSANIEARYSTETQRVQDELTQLTNAYQIVSTEKQTEISKMQSLGEKQGGGGKEFSSLEDAMRESVVKQREALKPLLASAEKIGNTELESTIKQEIANLNQTIATTTAEKISNVTTMIQRESGLAESKTSELLSKSKVAAERGNYVAAGQLEKEGLQNKAASLLSTKEEEEKLKALAVQEGDINAVVSLTEELNKNSAEIEENNIAINNNTSATRELVISQIQREGQLGTGIFGALKSGIETIGQTTGFTNVAGLLGAAKGEQTVLKTEQGALESKGSEFGFNLIGKTANEVLTYLASPEAQALMKNIETNGTTAEKESLAKYVSALDSNSTAILTNTEEIAKLNGSLNQPQSFSTEAFKQFRSSYFSGMGGLLPSYSAGLPASAVPTEMPNYGYQAPANSAPTIGHLSLTHPVEKIDPQLFGEELSYHIATAPSVS